uniref:Secreted protein n=1 Tax=Trichuris muris TaxID=70415 RepID=A0A5S6QRH3_TRIMR
MPFNNSFQHLIALCTFTLVNGLVSWPNVESSESLDKRWSWTGCQFSHLGHCEWLLVVRPEVFALFSRCISEIQDSRDPRGSISWFLHRAITCTCKCIIFAWQ